MNRANKEGTFCYVPPKHIDPATRAVITRDRDLIDLTIVFLQTYREVMMWDKKPLEPKYRANVHKALNALRMGHGDEK